MIGAAKDVDEPAIAGLLLHFAFLGVFASSRCWKHPTRWSFSMPTACMEASAVFLAVSTRKLHRCLCFGKYFGLGENLSLLILKAEVIASTLESILPWQFGFFST